MNISICRSDEYDDLADIFIEMEIYYNQTLCLSRRDMSVYLRDKIFAADSGTEVHKVVCDGVIAAFSCVSVMYPSPRFLTDLLIRLSRLECIAMEPT